MNARCRAPSSREKSQCLRTDGFDTTIFVETHCSDEDMFNPAPVVKYPVL